MSIPLLPNSSSINRLAGLIEIWNENKFIKNESIARTICNVIIIIFISILIALELKVLFKKRKKG